MIWIKYILNFKKISWSLGPPHCSSDNSSISSPYLSFVTTVHTLTSTHKTLVLFYGGIHFYFPIRQEQEGLKVQEGVVLIRYYIAA